MAERNILPSTPPEGSVLVVMPSRFTPRVPSLYGVCSECGQEIFYSKRSPTTNIRYVCIDCIPEVIEAERARGEKIEMGCTKEMAEEAEEAMKKDVN